MKKLSSLITLLLLCNVLIAQIKKTDKHLTDSKIGFPTTSNFWSSCTNGIYYISSDLVLPKTEKAVIGNVGIGTSEPLQRLHINGNIRGNQAGGALRVQTSYGYTDIGPKNSSYAHFITDRPYFYFNKGIKVNTGIISSYDEDLKLSTSGTTRITIKKFDGDVGIGTTSPTKKLDVRGDINYTGNLYKNGQLVSTGGLSVWTNTGSDIYYSSGEVGIGMAPTDGIKLQIKTGWGSWIKFAHASNSGYWAFHNGEAQTDFHIYYRSPDGSYIYPLRLKTDGSIETKELLVAEVKAKNIMSKELTLEIDNVADYVFDTNYKLNSLEEVEAFVKINKHLPGIPSAKVLEEQGVNVAEMSNLLLQKIEELTLYY